MLARILDAFESGNVPEALARTMLPRIDVPCNRWAVELLRLEGTAQSQVDSEKKQKMREGGQDLDTAAHE